MVGRIPGLAAGLQPREVDRALSLAFEADGAAVHCQVISGMGGVGKTQAAAAFARRRWEEGALDLLVWVSAVDRGSILEAYAAAAAATCAADATDPRQAAEAFLSWLDRPDAPRWLIVLDDLADPDHLAELWPPSAGRGRTIVTTRRRDAALDGAGRRRIDLGVFTPEQARGFLRNRLGGHSSAIEGADSLAAELGHLPLALGQAAAFIRDQPGSSCSDYAEMVRDQSARLSSLSPDRLPDGYPTAVAACWWISMNAALGGDEPELAMSVISLASLLDPAGIPVRLFTAWHVRSLIGLLAYGRARPGPIRRWIRRLTRPSRHFLAPEYELLDVATESVLACLGRLHRLSLVDFDGEIVRIHALVQRVVRDELSPDSRDVLATTAANAILETWDTSAGTRFSLDERLGANIASLRRHAQQALIEGDAFPLLLVLGSALGENGSQREAADYFHSLGKEVARLRGADHPDAFRARREHAWWRGMAGDPAGALTVLRSLLADQIGALGADDPTVLSTREHAAHWRAETGDITGALAEAEALLRERTTRHGEADPVVFRLRRDIARWHGELGDAARALEDLELLLDDMERVCGENDYDTLVTRSGVAHWRGECGDVAGALAASERLVADLTRTIGADRPPTLAARAGTASWRNESGDVSGALVLFEALLADQVRVFGPDHPETLQTRGKIASARGYLGDSVAAATEFGALLADCTRILGPHHPDTLGARGNLAVQQGENGDLKGSLASCEALLRDQVRTFGPDHPDPMLTRHNIAALRGRLDGPAAALDGFAALLPDQVRVFGPEHPATITTQVHLAHWRGRSGACASARAEFEALLPVQIRIFGADHPDTLRTRHQIALWQAMAGDPEGARAAFEALLADQTRAFGPDHPSTQETREELRYYQEHDE